MSAHVRNFTNVTVHTDLLFSSADIFHLYGKSTNLTFSNFQCFHSVFYAQIENMPKNRMMEMQLVTVVYTFVNPDSL